MDPQTRKLLQTIADPLNDAIFEELHGGPQTAGDLVDRVDPGEKTLYRRLSELVKEDLLESEASPESTGRAGRRARVYRIADPQLIQFRNAADAFTLDRLDRLRARVENHMKSEREKQIRPAKEDPPGDEGRG